MKTKTSRNFIQNHNMPSFQIHSPIGAIAVRYSQSPFIIERIDLPSVSHDRISDETDTGKVNLSGLDSKEARSVYHLFRMYFESGEAIPVPWDLVRLDRLTPLQQAVLRTTADIPFAKCCTYRDIAEKIGSPRASRFVGNTLAINPYPLVIPCHRVIRSDGALGGFGGGTHLKEILIKHEEKLKHTVLANRMRL